MVSVEWIVAQKSIVSYASLAIAPNHLEVQEG